MNSNTYKEPKKIILNLDKSAENFGFEENELLQEEEYKKFEKMLQDSFEHKARFGKKIADIHECQMHDVIFVSGDRGSGKTTFLNSIKSFTERAQKSKNSGKKQFDFLPVIDPTLLHSCEQFLVILIGHIANFMEKNHLNACKFVEDKKKYYEKLTEITQSITKIIHDGSIVERIIDSQNSLQLEQRIHEFFKICVDICECEILILPIDDVDMAFQHGFDVLETVRKFLSSPYMIPVVSGDFDLYATIVKKQFSDQLYSNFFKDDTEKTARRPEIAKGTPKEALENHPLGYESWDWKLKIKNIANRYLTKVFPSDRRIPLPSVQEILESKFEHIFISSTKGGEFSLSEVYELLCNTFNAPIKWMGINNDFGINPIPLDSLRAFVQYLVKMKDIVTGVEENEKKQAHIKDIGSFFIFTADFYSNIYDRKFEYLCAKASCRNADGKKTIKSILFSEFFDPKFNPHEKPVLEKIDKSSNFIRKKDCNDLLKAGGQVQLYTELFTYRDYYTGHQQRFFIVVGKFMEFIWRSLDWKEGSNFYGDFKEIIDAKQQTYIGRRSAFLEIPDNNFFQPIRSADISSDDSGQDFFPLVKSTYEFVWDSLESWRKNYYFETDCISSAFIYKVTNKILRNLDVMLNESKEWGNETLGDYIKRICWILLNSIAFFERVNSGEAISETNIAVGMNAPEEKTLKGHDNAYQLNIAPLLKKQESLTYVMYFHPLINEILNFKANGKQNENKKTSKFAQIDMFDDEPKNSLSMLFEYNIVLPIKEDLNREYSIKKLNSLKRIIGICTRNEAIASKLTEIQQLCTEDNLAQENFKTLLKQVLLHEKVNKFLKLTDKNYQETIQFFQKIKEDFEIE